MKLRWVIGSAIALPLLIAVFVVVVLGGGSNCGSGGGGGAELDDKKGDLVNPMPDDLRDAYNQVAKESGVPAAVLAGMGDIESKHADNGRNYRMVSSAGAVGPMQFLPATFTGLKCGPLEDVYKALPAVRCSAKYLLQLADEKASPGKDNPKAMWQYAMCRYNGGCANGVAGEAGYGAAGEVAIATAVAYGYKEGQEGSLTVGGDDESCADDSGLGPVGSADINKVVRHTEPRKMELLPAWATAKGYTSPAIFGGRAKADARIIPAILWLLKRYDMRVHDCLASGHNTHGTGDSCDIVPASDPLPRPGSGAAKWKNVERMAKDFGWVDPGAGARRGYACNSGYPFKGGLYIICYNGDENHGDPQRTYGGCACPHIHITFDSPQHGAPTALGTPPAWVTTFAVSSEGEAGSEAGDDPKATKKVDAADGPTPRRRESARSSP
jgi:hypothetical protein